MRGLLAALAALLFAACASAPDDAATTQKALPAPSLEKIARGVWIHKSYAMTEKWGPVLSQGLVVQRESGVLLVDTAWNDDDTEKLLDLIKATTGEIPTEAVLTHAHGDKMGGVGALKRHEIETSAHAFSNEDAPARGLIPADESLALDEGAMQLIIGGGFNYRIQYPGAGHTRDNIVVYIEDAKVLFGGCLIRSAGANDLGNTADGDVRHWAQAVSAVAAAFPDAKIVIPSHGAKGGRDLLDHTIALAEAAAATLP